MPVAERAPSRAAKKRSWESARIEMDLLLEGVFRRYGYDFRGYDRVAIASKVARRMQEEGVTTISGLQEKLFHHDACMDRLLLDFTANGQRVFGDPDFYLSLRTQVLPRLRTYPYIRIWLAGCSTGEEVYTLAVLLKEEGLYDRARIYATDISESILKKAKEGVFPRETVEPQARDYLKSGGTNHFTDYFHVRRDKAVFAPALKNNVIFAQHNWSTDSSFNEFNVICCRNLLHAMDRGLQEKIFDLFHKSLCRFGFLALGEKDFIPPGEGQSSYEAIPGPAKLYRRLR